MDTADQCTVNVNMQWFSDHPIVGNVCTMEDRTLALLHDSKLDQEIGEVKAKKKGGRKHKAQWMKRPMALSDVTLELQDEDLRENALRCLSTHLVEKREQEPENYNKAGFFLFHSCSTMAILLQEVMSAYGKLQTGNLNIRGSKRLSNVLTLFQSIAANKETRSKFVNACIPNYLVPFLLFETSEDYLENVRAISLSVIGIVCQAREAEVIEWALKSNIVEVCLDSIQIGNELSKVIAMHIIESILQENAGVSHICESTNHLLDKLMEMCKTLACVLAVEQSFSPRLLFHVIRCYFLLCRHPRALDLLKENLPAPLLDDTFEEITKEFPMIHQLLNQLLLNVGKVEEVTPMENGINKNNVRHNSKSTSPCDDGLSPLHPINLNTEYLSLSASRSPILNSRGKEN